MDPNARRCQPREHHFLFLTQESEGHAWNTSPMKREHKFETIEHTADVGVVGRGSTMAEAFENVAYGMFSIMAEVDRYKPSVNKKVVALGEDDVVLLERFLSSLLVLFDADGLLPIDVEITELSMGRLTCWVSAHRIGDDIEWLGPQVKAVTYHQMAVESEAGEWMARAIFDV